MSQHLIAPSAAAVAAPNLSTAVKVAAQAADEVDREARFPVEAISELREARLLSCTLPRSVGGQGKSVAELAPIVRALGAVCGSTAMVFAMHHTQALTLAHHGAVGDIAGLTADIASQEALLASATTEISTGGDVRSSTCAVQRDGEYAVLEKNAPVISYGEYADYICVTARRGPESPSNDQVLMVCPATATELRRIGTWDVLGLRGTCSPGFMLKARTPARFIVPVDYATISEQTMLPASHTLWSSVWLGMADAALGKARAAVRGAVRKQRPEAPLQQARLAELTTVHQAFESLVIREIHRYDDFLRAGDFEPTVGFTIAMNNLKLLASEAVVNVVTGALQLIGINGYREDHEASMSRLLRDSFSAQLMVSNDRIRANNVQLALAYRESGKGNC